MEYNLSVIDNLLPVLTSGNTAVWVCNTATGQIEFKNDFFGILGLANCEVKPLSLSELHRFVHADDIQKFKQAFAEASSGKSATVAYRYCFGNKQIHLESKFLPCVGGVVACTKNTDSAMLLLRLEKQYKTVVNSMFPNFIWVFDYDFFIVDVILPDGLKLFHSREELIGADARNFYSPEVNELLISNIRESLKNNQWREIEYYIDLFGTRYFYQSRIVPVDENKVFCLCFEIGDRVRRMDELLAQRQRAEESDIVKNVFIENISHEIRTPLNAIIGFSNFLLDEEDPLKRQNYIDIVRNSNASLQNIVNDILVLSRLDARMTEFNFEDTDIASLIIDVAEIFLQDLKPQIRLSIDIPDGEIHAPTDAVFVKTVLSNLISNAIKNTEKGTITVKVEKCDEYLIFSITDTGRGIPEDKLDVIFDRFEKIDRFTQGTGLGLSICKFIVDRLGGHFKVTSKVGEGSVFSFNIPYRNLASTTENQENINSSKRKKILVSEKSEDTLIFLREILSKNYDIVEVTDDEKMINSLIFDNPNLMLIDMEVASEKENIEKIRTISATIPIIAMTSSDYYHDQRRAFENGCTDVIAKPFSVSKLQEVVMAFLK